jgi:hypothetical protein
MPSVMYIPCYLKSIDNWTKSIKKDDPDSGSFTLQNEINPKMIAKRFRNFKFNKYLNEFQFCDESGVEYHVHSYLHGDEKIKLYGTCVTIFGSLNLAEDLTKFSNWLCDNFKK